MVVFLADVLNMTINIFYNAFGNSTLFIMKEHGKHIACTISGSRFI